MSEFLLDGKIEKEDAPFFTRGELEKRIQQANDEDWGKSEKNEYEDGLEKLLAELLGEKERFDFVFRTEKGSHYFVLKDGSSFRIQRKNPAIHHSKRSCPWKLFPIAEHIFFVDASQREKLRYINEWPGFCFQKGPEAPENKIVTIPFAEGATPFEYNFSLDRGQKPRSRAIFRKEGLVMTFLGIEEEGRMAEIDPNLGILNYPTAITHFGHPVSEILWDGT